MALFLKKILLAPAAVILSLCWLQTAVYAIQIYSYDPAFGADQSSPRFWEDVFSETVRLNGGDDEDMFSSPDIWPAGLDLTEEATADPLGCLSEDIPGGFAFEYKGVGGSGYSWFETPWKSDSGSDDASAGVANVEERIDSEGACFVQCLY